MSGILDAQPGRGSAPAARGLAAQFADLGQQFGLAEHMDAVPGEYVLACAVWAHPERVVPVALAQTVSTIRPADVEGVGRAVPDVDDTRSLRHARAPGPAQTPAH